MNNKKCLVTQDLVSSVDWLYKAPDTVIKGNEEGLTWSRKAYIDLEQKLNRIYGDMPEAAKRGIDFENKLYNAIQAKIFNKGSVHFQRMADRLKNHAFQEKIKVNETIGEYDCFLYGKIDAWLAGDMVDVKTTAKFSKDKYEKSFQHLLYCYAKDERVFTYLVAEWLDFPSIKEVHEVSIVLQDKEELKEKIHSTILDTFEKLKELDLWSVYREKYCLY